MGLSAGLPGQTEPHLQRYINGFIQFIAVGERKDGVLKSEVLAAEAINVDGACANALRNPHSPNLTGKVA